MSRLRTTFLSLTAVTAVAALGFLMAPAGAATTAGTDLVTAASSTTPTSPPPSTTPPPPPGQEGCTPGFWKTHPEAWAGTAYSPTTTLGSVFTGLSPTYATMTFLQALNLGGGGLNALLRHAVAALLNATNADVAYPLTADQIIALVNAALASGNYESAKNLLDRYNNLTSPGFCD